jgi:hypothetical protein
MSLNFGTGPTRDVQPGDTPDLNDGLLSFPQTNQNIPRGTACYINGTSGLVTIATGGIADTGASPFVPVESVDNSGGSGGATEMSGVTAPQRVAMTIELDSVQGLTIFPGDYLRVEAGGSGVLQRWIDGNNAHFKYARFLGIEAALLDRDTSTPFDETLTPGIVPDQSVTGANNDTFVGWVQLMENPGV